jgi:hypothetical protein
LPAAAPPAGSGVHSARAARTKRHHAAPGEGTSGGAAAGLARRLARQGETGAKAAKP